MKALHVEEVNHCLAVVLMDDGHFYIGSPGVSPTGEDTVRLGERFETLRELRAAIDRMLAVTQSSGRKRKLRLAIKQAQSERTNKTLTIAEYPR